ncbi:MAG: J domain-containing protein [Deltaproteobacteria bacterium]|nr:J domain-containing protein [Deltaproteobacteria bacterium]MBN2846778.1 J domain-containing protein [Deltaproteobacteria bacterium]
MEHMDYYQVLGIEKDAEAGEIKDSYRKLALKYHPDRNNGDPASAEKMKSINEAYAVLSNPQKRQDYDLMRDRYGSSAYGQFRQTYSDQDIFRGSDINRIFEELARSFGLRGFEDIFKDAYGNGYRTFEFRTNGTNGRGYVFTGNVGRGGESSVQFPHIEGGLGKIVRFAFKKLSGIELPEKGRDLADIIRLEPREAATGGSREYTHWGRDKKKIMIKIPAGVKDGQKIRLAGMGETGKGGAEPGDLYLKVHIKKPILEEIKGFINNIINK